MSRSTRAAGGLLASAFALTLVAPTVANAAPSPTPTRFAKTSSTSTASPTPTRTASPRADATSFDDRVIFQSFSLYQPYDKQMYANFAANTSLLNSWGVTDVWLPPPYRSFGMARYMEGYAIADRYDLGEFPQGPNNEVATKYGSAAELKTLMNRLHQSNLRAQVDLVPNQMMGLGAREAVVGTRTDQNGNPFVNVNGQRTSFIDQTYLAYTKGGGRGQAEHGAIKEFNKSHFNGSSLQQIGFGDTLKDANGKPYRVDQTNAADNNVPAWMNVTLGKNTVEGYLSAHDAYEATQGNWRPYLINDPAFVTYAKAKCGFPDDAAVKAGASTTGVSIWDCRDRFMDPRQDYSANPEALPGTKYNSWGEEPSFMNSGTGIDNADQVRFAGHTINRGITPSDEFLVGNDLDNSNAAVQAEQRNWVRFLLNQYGFDGFRVDAAAHYDVKILDMIAEEMRVKFGGDPSRYLSYLETYDARAANRYADATGNQHMVMDAWQHGAYQNSLSGGAPIGDLWRFSAANVTGSRAAGGTYRPNWSFVNNHDQEKNRVNAIMMGDMGIRPDTRGCVGGPGTCRSFEVEWTKAKEDAALKKYNADLKAPSNLKRYSPRNVPAMYAVMLTNRATTPTVSYNDMYVTNAAYMAEKTPYHDEIEALLKARKAYAKGEQKTFDFANETTGSVRLGNDRHTGLATIISKNPKVDQWVRVNMGRDHANQAFRDVLGKSNQTYTTDGQGNLDVYVRGSDTTPEVSGFLGVFAPVDATIQKATHGAIGMKWQTIKGELGNPTSGEMCYLRDGGCFQNFERGSIYWSPANGAHFVRGAIQQKWGQEGWENGWLGYPTSDELCGLPNGGCSQTFQGGIIFWSPATGAHFTRGLILDKYAVTGYERGVLGYPTTDEICAIRDGGCYNHFQGGSIYYSPKTGAHWVRGLIRERWAALGWEAGFLGYPVTDESCGIRAGGCYTHFEGGSIYYSPASGTWEVRGLIRQHWARNRWEAGRYGYPISPETCGAVPGARQCTQRYQGGVITYNSARGTY